MFCILKNKKHIVLMYQSLIQIVKTSYSFNDSKRRKIALSCSKKTISIINLFLANGIISCPLKTPVNQFSVFSGV